LLILGRVAINLAQKGLKFFATGTLLKPAGHFTGEDVESGVQGRRPMAFVIVGAAADIAEVDRQPGLGGRSSG
jgi:hypothetical protein